MIRRVNIPGRGMVWLETEDGPLSTCRDEVGLAWRPSIRRAAKSIGRRVGKVGSFLGKTIGKATVFPLKVTSKAVGDVIQAIPGKTAEKVGGKVSQTGVKAASAAGNVIGVSVLTPLYGASLPAPGITKGVRQAMQDVGGRQYGQMVEVGKIAVPVALTAVGLPMVGAAASAGLTARDVTIQASQTRQAEHQADADIRSAYDEYVRSVEAAGYSPVSFEHFRNWAVAGGQGDVPLGPPVGQAGAQPSTIPGLPLLLLGGVALYYMGRK